MKLESFSTPDTHAEERKASVIRLDFFRHSIKEKSNPFHSGDASVPLSPEGRTLAQDRAFEDANINQAVAFGSPRIRTQETAAIRMSGENAGIDELRETLDGNLNYGSKIGTDANLDFTDDESSPVGEELLKAYEAGTYTEAVIRDSDRLAAETGDATGANYSHKASQIAKIIQKYVQTSGRWNDLVNDPSKSYTPQLERYLSSHQSMLESFLAKALELSGQTEAFEQFIAENRQGFDFLGGFRVEIEQAGSAEPSIILTYKLHEEEHTLAISSELLEKIIGE
jgi:broad specificity phosphatase PhoE